MLVYKDMNPNIALGIAIGGAFLFCQIAIALIFKSKLMPLQWIGIAAIVFGTIVFAAGVARESGITPPPTGT